MKSTLEIIVFINLRIKKKKIVLEDSSESTEQWGFQIIKNFIRFLLSN